MKKKLEKVLIKFSDYVAARAGSSLASLADPPAETTEPESTEPEMAIAPHQPTVADSDQNASAPSPARGGWKWCPDITPFVQGTTMQAPLCDLDIQKSIRAEAGFAPSLPAIRKRIWRLASEGKIRVYFADRHDNMYPYPARRSTHKPYVVWNNADIISNLPEALQPEPLEASREPGCEVPIAVGAEDAMASPSPLVTTLDIEALPVRETTAQEMPIGPKELAGWMLQNGLKKFVIEMEYQR